MYFVVKKVAPLGRIFKTYLRKPHSKHPEYWDEKHDATPFPLTKAFFYAIKHVAWIEKA
jgi:hypothetical protein